MVFTKDGTLWLATIFGTIMTYKEGQLLTDEYASNEYGDAVVAVQTDSIGRLEEPVERMPQWVWWALGALFVVLLTLIGYVRFLHRQRKRFMETMRRLPIQEQAVANGQNEKAEVPIVQTEEQPSKDVKDERLRVGEQSSGMWLKKAINMVAPFACAEPPSYYTRGV